MKKLFTLMLALFAMVAIQAQSLLVQDFENGIPSTWLNIDADGDGNSWLSSENTTGVSGHNGSNGCAYSCSYYDGTVLHPDNWLITEAVNLTGASTLTFWVCAQDASYAAEHYGVYISTTGTATSDFTLLFEETIDANGGSRVQGAWKQKTVNLSNYTGQTVRIAFRHFNCSDMFYFNLDDVEIVAAPTTPTIVASQNVDFGIVHLGNNATQQVAVSTYNLTAGVTATVTGPFTISADGNTFGTTANIAQAGGTLYVNYAPTATGNSTGSITLSSTGAPTVTVTLAGNCIDCSNNPIPYSCDFTNATQNECWTIVDANNDGSTFIIDENNGYAYYYYNSTNYANDYLISPSFSFTGSQTVMFDYAAYSSSYPEIFEVFAIGTDTVRLTQPTTVTNTTFNTETMNLPNLNGSYSIAIHCISENDKYALIISNFKVLDASSSIVDVTPASITFNTIATGTTDESTFNISTTNLNEIITITTSAPFEVSADGNTYATTITIPADSNYLTSTDVYVRFAPTVGGTFTGVVLVTTPTSSDTIVLNGIGVECNAISTFPFNEDFSATSTSIPCWQFVDANNDGKTFSIANGYASCPYHSTNPADDWLLSPEITFTGNEMGSFEYWCGSTSWSERFEVYAIGADTVLLVNSVDVTNSSSNPQTQYLALSSLTGNYRIGIHCISDADQLRLYIDNFNISAAVTSMNVTPASIDFGIVPASNTGNATFVATILNASSDITVTTAAPFSVSLDGNTYATSVTIPTPSTSVMTQTIYVGFTPTAGTTYTGEVVLSTTGAADTVALFGEGIVCDVITTLPFNETFDETSSTRDCWQVVDANNDGSTISFMAYDDNNTGVAVYFYDANNNANDWLISPEITLPTGGVFLSYDYAASGSTYPEKYSVWVIPQNGTIATAVNILATQTVATNTITNNILDLSTYGNQTIRVAFKVESDADMNYIFFDNVSVSAIGEASITVNPTSMSFSGLVNSATSAQTANVVAMGLTNDVNITATAPFEVSVDGNAFAATATIPQATVLNTTIYVRMNATTAGAQTGTVNLTSGTATATIALNGSAIDCSGAQALPFTENFEGELAECWQNIDNDGDTYVWESSFNPASYYPAGVNLSGQGNNGSDGFYLSGSYTNVMSIALTPDNWLITPALAIPATGATLKWWVAAQDADYPADHYEVKVSTAGTSLNSFTSIFDETLSSDVWSEHSVSLNNYAGQNIHIAFVHNNCTDQFVMKIDDISVTPGVGINDNENNVSIYPNPANNVVNVNAASNINNVEIFNMMGQKVAAFDANDTNVQINTTALSNGMYMMRITTENGVSNQKFTVAR